MNQVAPPLTFAAAQALAKTQVRMPDLKIFRHPSPQFRNQRSAAYCVDAPCFDQDLRARHLPRLLVVVAGYKPQLWPLTLQRIRQHAPADTDICVVCPGKPEPELKQTCAALGWSFVSTRENRLSQAQNLAIMLHPLAGLIHKLDEDIVVSTGYFEAVEETYLHAEASGDCDVGFVAPTLNVNGFSYRSFLNFLSPLKLVEFRGRFGDSRSSCMNTAAWRDPLAAQFLWEQSMPFDPLAARFRARPVGYDICPHRFSIGALLMRRSLWIESGGFTVAREGELGVEEADLCAYCCDSSLLMLVSHRAFAGHVAFGPQAGHMIPWLIDHDLNCAP